MVNSTDAIAFCNSDLDVALIAPGSTPRVTHEPVIKARCLISSVANDSNGVICADTTFSGIKNTTRVVLEDILSSIDGNSDRLLCYRLFHGFRILRSDTLIRGKSDTTSLGH